MGVAIGAAIQNGETTINRWLIQSGDWNAIDLDGGDDQLISPRGSANKAAELKPTAQADEERARRPTNTRETTTVR